METRANNALIGLFTVLVVAAAIGFVLWFSRTGPTGSTRHIQVVFSDSVTGLTPGSSVMYNGFRVGQVDTLDLLPEDPSRVVADVTVRANTPLKTDTRARLEFQGLTGGAYLQLFGGTASAPALKGADRNPPTIYAERSEYQNIVDGAREAVSQASQAIARIDELLRRNEARLNETIGNVHTFTGALAKNADQIENFMASVGEASKSISKAADGLSAVSGDVQALVKAVDPAKINQSLDNVERFTAALGNNSGEIDAFIKNSRRISSDLVTMTPKLDATVDTINRVATSLDSEKISRAVDNIDRFTAALGNSTATYSQFVKDAGEIGQKVNQAADRLDKVMANIENLTSSDGSKGMFAEITEAARSMRTLAENLDARTAELSRNLNQFAGSGLREYRELAANGQRTLAEIQRVLGNFQRNPQQLIFGPKSTIPDYRGR